MSMHLRFSHLPIAGLLATLLVACASPVPLAIRELPADSPSLEQVRSGDSGSYLGQQVRFGGTIIQTDNKQDDTRLVVLGRPLTQEGDPGFTDDSAGRFIAIVPEFLDPKVYAPDRDITVTGKLVRTDIGKVGEFPYSYPVVEAMAWHLWPKQSLPAYWYDPWHQPWHYGRGYNRWRPLGYPYHYWP